jgi:hypothetical protein
VVLQLTHGDGPIGRATQSKDSEQDISQDSSARVSQHQLSSSTHDAGAKRWGRRRAAVGRGSGRRTSRSGTPAVLAVATVDRPLATTASPSEIDIETSQLGQSRS